MRELEQLLAESRAGRGGLALLGGEPGIGKSRLADEVASRARAAGHDVFWGRAWEDAGAPPYWPWIQVLRSYLRLNDAASVRAHLGQGAADIAQLLPELRDLVADSGRDVSLGSESARSQLFDSIVTLLRRAARDRPLLIVLDDLHASDMPSILLVRFLSTQLADMSVLLIGTYRDVELTPDHPLTIALGEVAREPTTHLVSLRGLPAEDVGALIAAGAKASSGADARAGSRRSGLVQAVWRATSGNPLFVGEAVRLLTAEGRLDEVDDGATLRVAVPAGVRAVIARRIDRLRQPTVDLLRTCAVIGPEVGLDVLRRLSDDPDAVPALVGEAVESGLLVASTGSPGRYRFSHDLFRETLDDEIEPEARSRLHGRIAAALEASDPADRPAHLAELAFHAVQAVRLGASVDRAALDETQIERAADYARHAGDEAAQSLGYEEAVRLYRMSLAVLEVAAIPNEPLRAETLLSLGDAQERGQSLEEARDSFVTAAEISRRLGDGPRMARAALGIGGRHFWTRPGNDGTLIPLLQDALVLLGGADERLRVLLLARLACAWRSSPERRSDSDALSRQAVETARRIDDLGTLSHALLSRFWATWWPENPEERERLAAEIAEIAGVLGDGDRIIEAHLVRFLSLSELGRLAEARQELNALVRGSEDIRQPAQRWLGPVNRAYLAVAVGDFTNAEEMIERQLGARTYYTPARDALSTALMQRFLVRREQGRGAEEEATIRTSMEDFPWYPYLRAALACLLAEGGREPEARAIFDALARDSFRALYRDNEWLLGMALASDACAILGDRAAAAVLAAQLAPFAGRLAIAHGEGCVGAVDRYLGLLAATLGDVDGAIRHLRAAIELNTAMGTRPWIAHSRHDLATVLRRRAAPGDIEEADALDRAARALAEALGMALAGEIVAPAMEPGAAAVATNTIAAAVFRREGEYWTVEFGDEGFRMRDSKGMRHLARLLGAPGSEIHALDLAAVEAPPREATTRGPAGAAGLDLEGTAFSGAGPTLDAAAKAAYRERLNDLRAELAEAEGWNDPERAARLESEIRALTHELAGALGLGGRDRPTASAAERSRVSATRAIRASMDRIRANSQSLGDHLEATIRTGAFCSYNPDPRAPITWLI